MTIDLIALAHESDVPWRRDIVAALMLGRGGNGFSGFSSKGSLKAGRSALRPGGAVACNVIGALAGAGPLKTYVSAARAVFDDVRIVPVVDLDEHYSGSDLRNVVVVATRG